MKKHYIKLLTLGLCSLVMSMSAQNSDKNMSIELNGGIRDYLGDLGTTYLFTDFPPNYQSFGLSFGYYINPSLDAVVFGSAGEVGYYSTLEHVLPPWNNAGFRATSYDLTAGLRYKFDNGYILSEESRIAPYVQLGWGGMYVDSKINNVGSNYKGGGTALNGAIGFNFKINETVGLRLQTGLLYSFNDAWDGQTGDPLNNIVHTRNKMDDAYYTTSLGVYVNFGGSKGPRRFKDSDNDGVPNSIDKCRRTPEGWPVDSVGCPIDTDGDGIYDGEDSCINTKGTKEFNGCPVDKADFEIMELAVKGINFESSKAVIRTESYNDLNKLVAILNKYPAVKVFIEGHTDNTGNAASNLDLSKRRAASVKKYLQDKGIAADRMTTDGFGQTRPKVLNNSSANRLINRRVEFKLSY